MECCQSKQANFQMEQRFHVYDSNNRKWVMHFVAWRSTSDATNMPVFPWTHEPSVW